MDPMSSDFRTQIRNLVDVSWANGIPNCDGQTGDSGAPATLPSQDSQLEKLKGVVNLILQASKDGDSQITKEQSQLIKKCWGYSLTQTNTPTVLKACRICYESLPKRTLKDDKILDGRLEEYTSPL